MAKSCDLEGLNKWLKEVGGEIEQKVKEEVEKYTELTCDEAKMLVNVDTSNLQKSIDTFYSDDGLTGNVFTNVEYAVYQEEGTYRMPSYAYFEPSYEKFYPQLIEALENLFKGGE